METSALTTSRVDAVDRSGCKKASTKFAHKHQRCQKKIASASGITGRILSASGYDLTRRVAEFLRSFPGLRGQYNLDLVECSSHLLPDERQMIKSNYAAVFKALRWTLVNFNSPLETLVPDSRTPFKDCCSFVWYAYCPYSKRGSRMQSLYQNVMFNDSSTWYMTNKQNMLRRLLLAEAATQAVVDAGLVSQPDGFIVSSRCFIPPSQVYSLGKEFAVVSKLGLFNLDASTGVVGSSCCIVKPSAGLKGRGIRLYRPAKFSPDSLNSIDDVKRRAALDFTNFMLSEYGQSQLNAKFYIVQRYIDRPLLIGGRKFDLRVYLLLVPNMACGTDCDSNPGRRGFYAFYHPGFARLSGRQYADESDDLAVHLTNSYQQETSCPNTKVGDNSWTPDRVNEYFNERYNSGLDGLPGRDWFRVTAQADIQAILAYTVSRFAPQLSSSQRWSYNAFKLLGCDFLIDVNRRVWLLELNSLPSWRILNDCHRVVKPQMQREALALAIEVAHRSANGLPVTSECLVMRQNFLLISCPIGDGRVQAKLVQDYGRRLMEAGGIAGSES